MAVVKTGVSEDHIASIITVTRIDELRTVLALTIKGSIVTANVVPSSPVLVTLMMEAIRSYVSSVLKKSHTV
jgi:hypothetical protein